MSRSVSFKVSPWLTCYESRPDARLRLFCIPHGGGGPQAYKSWAESLPAFIEVYSLHLPGRGTRRKDTPIHSMERLSEEIGESLSAHLDKPYALFGHSVGALIAYEVASRLEEKGQPLPIRLMVSAHKAPHLALEEDPMYSLPDEELIRKIAELGLVPRDALENEELLDFILPPLKADFEVSETYRYIKRDPLSVSITAMGGEDDPLLNQDDLQYWSRYSREDFSHISYKGDHFYTESYQEQVLEDMAGWLADDLERIPKAVKEGPEADYPQKCLHELFREQAAAHPDRIAVADPRLTLTFRELDEKTDLLARYLQKQGMVVDRIGGIYLDSSVEYVIAYLGILKAGGAYMPVELAYPGELLKRVLEKARPVTILTKNEFRGGLPESWQVDGSSFSLDEGWEERLASMDLPELDKDRALPEPDSLAYCVMTSGTTGTPKGIICPHRGAVNSYYWRYRNHPYETEEREGCNVFLVWEVIRPLLQGYPSYVIPDDVIYDPWKLVDFLEKYEITRVLFTPSLLEQVFNTPGLDLENRLTRLKIVWLNGEVVPTALRNRFFERFPGVKLLNDYSISECHDVCTHDLEHLNPLFSPKYASLGYPMDNVRLYLLDENLEPVPLGMSAEIYVGGDSLARGYLDEPEKTTERFIPDPVRKDGSRLFRTGDLGRFLPNGELEVKGRVEFMIKLRGYSIVPGAVEAAITEFEGINTSVVVTKDSEETGQPEALVAYIVGDGSIEGNKLEKALRLHLKERLPHYAIPSYFIPLEELPLHDVTGKLDRKKLPDPDAFVQAKKKTKKPASSGRNLEGTIVDIWEEVLNIRATDREDNFFDLGGHSLSAITICDKLSQALSVDISVIDIYENPTVMSLARFLVEKREEGGLSLTDFTSGRKAGAGIESEGVAVVGISARFPGAQSAEEFWENLTGGVCSIKELSREELEEKGIPESVYTDPDYRPVGAFLDDVDKFDYPFFGLSKKEADLMDPQHRLFLQCCWEAMENSGYAPTREGDRTGVFGGCYSPLYLLHNLRGGGFMDPTDPTAYHMTETGNDKDYLATRVSYMLNLQGPSVSVQTSCSTAASVVATACESLLAGKCDRAMAGASSITFPQGGYQYVEGHINSREGKVKAFDAGADGTILGDGVGVMVLKRLEDALEDGDHIYSVIKGFAVNNDGNNKAGYSAPSVHGQKNMVVEALEMAGVGAESLSYMEAHGTGTLIGDPIEIRALTDVYRSYTDKKAYCALGSVKPNIGHSNIASGMVGLIKTSLSLYHKQIPPTINYSSPNPAMNIGDSPFYVNDKLSDWETTGEFPRRAGVSCLGIGGTNVHFILEEPPVREERRVRKEKREGNHILTLSAKSVVSLENMSRNLSVYLEKHQDIRPADLAYTLRKGRETFPFRRVVPFNDISAAVEGLKKSPVLEYRKRDGKVVFLFPGQGSQHSLMGYDLYRTDGVYRKHFDYCCDRLIELTGKDLRILLFSADKPEEAFRYAYYVQPLIFSLQYSLARTFMERGIIPDTLAGHSIGEYTAACLSGVFSLDDALALVTHRGRVMEEAGGGAMTAVELTPEQAHEFLDGREDINLAVINGDRQVVLSGTVKAVEAVETALAERGITCERVNVKQAFHSFMMEEAAEKLTEEANKIPLAKPQIPFQSNLSGTWITEKEACDPSYWGRHMRGTVRFADNVKSLLADGPAVMVETGSHRILGKLVKTLTAAEGKERPPLIVSAMRHPRDGKSTDDWMFVQTLGQLWAAGLPVDWDLLSPEKDGRKIPLPGTYFEKIRCWAENSPENFIQGNRRGKIENIADRGFIPTWTRRMIGADRPVPEEKLTWLIFSDPERESLISSLTDLLESRGDMVNKVIPSDGVRIGKEEDVFLVNPADGDQFGLLLDTLHGDGCYPEKVLYFWTLSGKADGEKHEINRSYYPFLNLAKALERHTSEEPLNLYVITDRTFQISGEEIWPAKSTLIGPAVVLPQENPLITCHILDFLPQEEDSPRLVNQILREALPRIPEKEALIAIRGKNRWIQTYVPASLPSSVEGLHSSLDEKGVYIITGGLGRIGRTIAGSLAAGGASLTLTTTRDMPERNRWETLLKAENLDERLRTSLEDLKDWEEKGYKVQVVQSDMASAGDVDRLLTDAMERYGKVTGIFHAAGTADLKSLRETGRDVSEREFASKVYGLWNWEKAVESCRDKTGREPEFFMLFSSMASILGGYSMAAYCGANRFMDAYAQSRSMSGGPAWIAVNWDDWDFEYTKEQTGAYEKTTARFSMTPDEGIETVRRVLSLADPVQILVSTRPLEPRISQWLHQSAGGGENREMTVGKAFRDEGDLKERIGLVFQDVLGLPDLAPEDNFFDSGGDSLLASRILLKLRRNLKKHADRITLNSIFDYPSVNELAGWLEE